LRKTVKPILAPHSLVSLLTLSSLQLQTAPGSRISLISKKNIRYEGTLYSINESDATVALQNVRSYGTEGREKLDAETTTFVAPQDSVHLFLLFRGCDIKDLHVHEAEVQQPEPSDAPSQPPPKSVQSPAKQQGSNSAPANATVSNAAAAESNAWKQGGAASAAQGDTNNNDNGNKNNAATSGNNSNNKGPNPNAGNNSSSSNNNSNNSSKRQPRKHNQANMVGTGASLLNRKERGTKDGSKSRIFQDCFEHIFCMSFPPLKLLAHSAILICQFYSYPCRGPHRRV